MRSSAWVKIPVGFERKPASRTGRLLKSVGRSFRAVWAFDGPEGPSYIRIIAACSPYDVVNGATARVAHGYRADEWACRGFQEFRARRWPRAGPFHCACECVRRCITADAECIVCIGAQAPMGLRL